MNQKLSEEQVKALQEKLKNMKPEEIKELIKQQCLFCQISEGKIEAKKIYEDDFILAILDINPASKGHTLVFPKEHYQVLSQVPDKLIGDLFNVANKLSGIIFEGVKADGTNIFVANGPAAGQNSPHAVIHIIPRFNEDKVGLMWEPKKGDEEELKKLQEEIGSKASQILVKKEEPKKVQEVVEEKEEEPEEPEERIP